MNNFDFQEALAFMKCGLAVKGPDSKVYRFTNGSIICYPNPTERPKQWHTELRFTTDLILSNNWSLYETDSK